MEPYVAHCAEEFVTLYDGFPKAFVHLLVVPRRQHIVGLGACAPRHLPLLRRLAAYVAWVLHGIAGLHSDMKICTHGIHSVPSLRQLHVHVMSQDFQSPCLKNAKHFNSFQPPFFVSLPEVIEELEGTGDVQTRFRLTQAEDDLKKKNLICHRCGSDFNRRFAELKRHLDSCTAAFTQTPSLERWQIPQGRAPLPESKRDLEGATAEEQCDAVSSGVRTYAKRPHVAAEAGITEIAAEAVDLT